LTEGVLKRRRLQRAAQEECAAQIGLHQSPAAFEQVETLAGHTGQRVMCIEVRVERVDAL